MMWILWEIPVFLLTAGKGKTSLLVSFAVFFTLLMIAVIIKRKYNVGAGFELRYPSFSGLISLFLSALFYLRWNTSGRIQWFAELTGKPIRQSCILIALLLSLLSLPGIDYLLKIFISPVNRRTSDNESYISRKYILGFTALCAFLTMFLNSRCSPLYLFNSWVDPNTMFTVGKGVLKGYVPYRDLYEQKGPLLVFLHTFGASVSWDTFIGMWLLELAACFAFLYLAYRITALYFGQKSLLIVPFASAVIYGCYAFRAGDLAEEYALPCFAWALYVGLKALKSGCLPSRREFFLTGITSGFVFWMKYSLVGMYIGWFLVLGIFSVFRKKIMDFLRGLGMIAAGVLLITVPVFVYFAVHSALDSLFEAYFYNNLFYYSHNEYSFPEKMKAGLNFCQRFIPVPMVLSVIGLLWMIIRGRWKSFLLILSAAAGCFVLIFIGGINHWYTSFGLAVYSLFGLWLLPDLTEMVPDIYEKVKYRVRNLSVYAMTAGLLLLCVSSFNLRILEYTKEMIFQYQMKEIIEKSGNTDPKVLAYGIGDPGVNTVAGLIPNMRFFCNYLNERLAEISEEQKACIDSRCVDYIITTSKWEDRYPQFETYDHKGCIVGLGDDALVYYHYYTPN